MDAEYWLLFKVQLKEWLPETKTQERHIEDAIVLEQWVADRDKKRDGAKCC